VVMVVAWSRVKDDCPGHLLASRNQRKEIMELTGISLKKGEPLVNNTSLDLELAAQIIKEADSIEDLVLRAIEQFLEIRMIVLKEQDLLMIELVGEKSLTRRIQSPVIAGIPLKQIKRPQGYQPLNETFHKFADKDGYLHDAGWWRKRDARLGVKQDKWNPEIVLAPAGSLRELILSYLLSRTGSVSIKRDIVHIASGVKHSAELELLALGDVKAKGPYFREMIHIRIDYLERLVRNRKKKTLI